MRQVVLVVGVLCLSGCAAPQAHRQVPQTQCVGVSEPAWWTAANDTAKQQGVVAGPVATLEFVRFEITAPPMCALVERLGLTSEPAVLSDAQFKELFDTAEASNALREWPRFEVHDWSTVSIVLGRGDSWFGGTALYVLASDISATGAKVRYNAQYVGDENNWIADGEQELELKEAAAHLVTRGDGKPAVEGIAVLLSYIGPARWDRVAKTGPVRPMR
jgi:hypothetical protein